MDNVLICLTNIENVSLPIYLSKLNKNYNVIGVLLPKALYINNLKNLDNSKNDIDIKFYYNLSNVNEDFDYIIIDSINENNKNFIKKLIQNIINLNKSYKLITPPPKDIIKHLGIELSTNALVESDTSVCMDYISLPDKIYKTNIPVCFVCPLMNNMDSSKLVYKLTEKFIENDYNVACITKDDFANLFNQFRLPDEMLKDEINIKTACFKLNYLVKYIETNLNKDLIIMQIPNGLLEFNHKLVNDFGLSFFIATRIIQPDYTIIYSHYDNYDTSFYNNISKYLDKVYDIALDAVHISNKYLDFFESDEQLEEKFVYIDYNKSTKLINNLNEENTGLKYFDLINNENDFNTVYNSIINKLGGE